MNDREGAQRSRRFRLAPRAVARTASPTTERRRTFRGLSDDELVLWAGMYGVDELPRALTARAIESLRKEGHPR